MERIPEKAAFLKSRFTEILSAMDPQTERRWGKMDLQQMIEHMADYTRIGSGKDPMQLVTPIEHLPKYQEFLRTEKTFKENTPNALMSEEPVPHRHSSITDAIDELQHELDHFFEVFANDPSKTATHPFFGDLDYEMSVQMLHKHAWHHLRQFGVQE